MKSFPPERGRDGVGQGRLADGGQRRAVGEGRGGGLDGLDFDLSEELPERALRLVVVCGTVVGVLGLRGVACSVHAPTLCWYQSNEDAPFSSPALRGLAFAAYFRRSRGHRS